MNKPLFVTMVESLLAKYGPVLAVPLPYTLRPQAEQSQRFVQEVCVDLVVDLEICGGEWRLLISKPEAARSVPYDG